MSRFSLPLLLALLATAAVGSHALVRTIRYGLAPPPSWQPSYRLNDSTAIMVRSRAVGRQCGAVCGCVGLWSCCCTSGCKLDTAG